MLQTVDDKIKEISEDEQALVNPSFVLEKESKVHAATQQAIDGVKAQVEELRKSYGELTDFCQQQTDLYVIFVKFHMMTRQVSKNQELSNNILMLFLPCFIVGSRSNNGIRKFLNSLLLSTLKKCPKKRLQ